MKPSDVRFLDPVTLEVIHTETVEEFREKRGKPEFRREEAVFDTVGPHLLTVPPAQTNYVMADDAIKFINKQPEPTRSILYDTLVIQHSMEGVAKKYDVSYPAVRQICSRFRKTLKEMMG
jgi:DNA-directed RNA polymerase specialized sigma24 family protein